MRQLATYSRAASASPRSGPMSPGASRKSPATTTATSTTSSAGSSRRARRAQNARSRIRPVPARSASSSDVIRKPDSTKNASTPRNPLGRNASPPWNTTTAATATARTPSSAGR
jgi:hypothetical protein